MKLTTHGRNQRTPHDGEPFYCRVCGLGWNEYGACEDIVCDLESSEAAVERAAGRRALAEGGGDG